MDPTVVLVIVAVLLIWVAAVARQYGPNPVQCPRCDHIWSGPPRHTIRG